METKYTLVEADRRQAENPNTFEIPSMNDRMNCKPGDLVRLIFNDRERMWVKITAKNAGGTFIGALDNDPVFVKTLKAGDPIEFAAKHIIDIYPVGHKTDKVVIGNIQGVCPECQVPFAKQ